MADGPSAKTKIKPVDRGLAQIGSSSAMKAHTLQIAQKIARAATQRGESSYTAKSRSVRTGWKNEARAGAAVSEKKKDWRDSRDRVLIRVTEQMKVRNRR